MRTARLLVFCWVVGPVTGALADEPGKDDGRLVVQVNRPARLLDHPLVTKVWSELSRSEQFQQRLASPEFDRVWQAIRFLESATGQDWPAALDQLTVGGMRLTAEPGPQLEATVVVTPASEEVLSRVHEYSRQQLRERNPAGRLDRFIAETSRRGTTCYRAGEVHYAIQGQHLVVASTADRLHAALDRLHELSSPADHATAGPAPLVQVRLDLATFRELPAIARQVALPSDDAARTAFLGGWIDLLRSGERLFGTLSFDGDGLGLALQVDSGHADLAAGLREFFASGTDASAAPLLDIPDTLYSASWYRDWGSLWDARGELLQTEVGEKLEQGNEDIRKQFSAFKIDFVPSELFSALGPHVRVVVARQSESPYRVVLEERLPAGLLAVDLQDEATFREHAQPLMRVVGLLLAVGRQGLLTRKTSYRDAELTGLWYADDERAAASGNRIRFQFNPTWTITRGHFLLGSTGEIVRQAIDELDRQAERHESASGPTERQAIVLAEAARALTDFDDAVVRGLVFDNGWTVEGAKAELAVLRRVLEVLGRIETHAGFAGGQFEYRVRVQLAE